MRQLIPEKSTSVERTVLNFLNTSERVLEFHFISTTKFYLSALDIQIIIILFTKLVQQMFYSSLI